MRGVSDVGQDVKMWEMQRCRIGEFDLTKTGVSADGMSNRSKRTCLYVCAYVRVCVCVCVCGGGGVDALD